MCKNPTQTLEFTNKVRCQGHPHITEAENEKPNAKQRHCCSSSTQIFQRFCVGSIILVANTQEQCWAPYPVCLHSHDAPNNSNFIQTKGCQDYHTHVGNTTICYYFFLVHHAQGSLAPVHNTNLTNCRSSWPLISTPFRKLVQIKALLPIGSQFQLHTPLQHTPSGTPFYVSFRLPQMQGHLWYFDCKRLEKPPPLEIYNRRIESSYGSCSSGAGGRTARLHQKHIVCCSSPAQQQQHTRQHSQTSNQGVKHQLICCTYFTSSASTQSNLLEHGLQGTLVQYIKTQSVQPTKSPKQEAFQSLLQCVEGLAMYILGVPAAQDCLWHQGCC